MSRAGTASLIITHSQATHFVVYADHIDEMGAHSTRNREGNLTDDGVQPASKQPTPSWT